jgi:hypothetical protein
LLMKSDEVARGAPLRGLSVKIAENTFLMGLSNRQEDRAFNLAHLQENAWIDIPVVYSNQRRAIIAIEKGASGTAIFQTAFAAWGQNPWRIALQERVGRLRRVIDSFLLKLPHGVTFKSKVKGLFRLRPEAEALWLLNVLVIPQR